MTAATLRAYRDDGPVAAPLGRLLSRAASKGLLLAAVGTAVLLGAVALDVPDVHLLTGTALTVAIPLLAAGREEADNGRLQWLVPPLLRATEYAFVIVTAAAADALPAAYALLAAIVFHHYEIVYRLRHQNVPPPAWVSSLGGGWAGRMLVVYALSLADAVRVGMVTLAALLGALFVSESVVSWVRVTRGEAAPSGRRLGDDGG